MKTGEEIRDFIKSLGGSSIEIAQTLRAKNITGDRVDSKSCPLANVLNQELDDGKYKVGTDEIVYRKWFRTIHVYLPYSAGDFVRDFDTRRYPDLER